MLAERWATFDCYGTLIDWNGGIRRELARVFGEEQADAQLERYHEIEPALQADGERTYREVMTQAMAGKGLQVMELEMIGFAARLIFGERCESKARARSRSSACSAVAVNCTS